MTSLKILSTALILACTTQTFGSDKFPEYHPDNISSSSARAYCSLESITDLYGNELLLHGETGVYTIFKNGKEIGLDPEDIKIALANLLQQNGMLIFDHEKVSYLSGIYNKLNDLDSLSFSSSSEYAQPRDSGYGGAGDATCSSSSISVKIPSRSNEERIFLRTLEIKARNPGIFSTLLKNYTQATTQKQNEIFQLYQAYREKFQESGESDAIASLAINNRLFQ